MRKMRNSRMLPSNDKVIWYLLILITFLDLVIPFLIAPFYNGYSHLKMVMSLLGNNGSPLHILYNSWMGILGIALCICAIKLYNIYKTVSLPLSISLLVLVLIFAVGSCLLSAFFPVGDGKEMITIASKIHGFGSVIGFVVLLFVPLIVAFLLYKQQDILGCYLCVLSFILAVVSFAFFVMADKTTFQNTFIANEGLWQRITLLLMYLPLDYLAITNILSR